MAHKLPDLPYDYSALEPHIDAQTMEIHHSRHHNGYVTNFNNAEEQYAIFGEEEEAFRAAARLCPEEAEAYLSYGQFLLRQDRPEEALRQFRAYAHLLRVETGLSPSLELKQALAGRPCPE